ncbi:MAG: hypothetical protein ABL902_01160 [Gallionella sp.]|nr:hypothetical protein [Gallionella sp.]
MRRIQRKWVDTVAQTYLNLRQVKVNQLLSNGGLNVEREWKSARQTDKMSKVLSTLQSMMGTLQRCMYCLDSHGCDIEHFRPKSSYPKWMFKWNNLLLCCTECGRIKGSQFPLEGKRPMLIDPTKEEPWEYLDFDPQLGNITAKFDLQTNDFSGKGQRTVIVLQLDRREALAAGYVQTYRKLCIVTNRFLQTPTLTSDDYIAELLSEDERGLLGWCFKGTGQNEIPFRQLKTRHPRIWKACCAAFKYR